MKQATGISNRGIVASIGYFDGVHRGHQFLIDQVCSIARERGMQSMLITFYEHPRAVLQSDYVPQLLTTPQEKYELLSSTGVDRVELLHFTRELSQLSASSFMKQILRDKFGVKLLVMGYDHRFGHDGGSAEQYRQWGKEAGIEVCTLPPAPQAGAGNTHNVSSTIVRRLLDAGCVDEAAQQLGHSYTLHGDVVGGHKVGRELGFPTANLMPEKHKLIPRRGAYAVSVRLDDGQEYLGMLNIGERPTVDDSSQQTIEVNLLDFAGDLYGSSMTIRFLKFLREEQRFDSRDALVAQLRKDEQTVRQLFLT